MLTDRNKVLTDSIRRLLRRGAMGNLTNIISKTHAADLSAVFRSLTESQQYQLYNLIEDREQKGLLLSDLDENTFLSFIEKLSVDSLVDVINEMASDDAADLIGKMNEDMADAILDKMADEESDEVEELLSYDDDTAGGIMVPDFIALDQSTTARVAVESIQTEHADVEMPFYLYVVDDHDCLVGVCSLRQLVVEPPDRPIQKFMSTEVYSVTTDMDQEEVAKIVAHYDILAVPVVDDHHRLVGIVTVDDVIDIFRREATEDILKMAGAGEEFVETQSILRSTKIRLPWLFASCIGGIAAFYIIGKFEKNLLSSVFLAAFIPVIMGMGGNIGTQSATIVVRGLAMGRFNVRDIWRVVGKELTIGLILGIVYGALIGLVAQLRYDVIMLGVCVGLAVLSSMTLAALVGSLVPMCLARFRIDPAVATGPFVTTAIDIISVYFYFQIAVILLKL